MTVIRCNLKVKFVSKILAENKYGHNMMLAVLLDLPLGAVLSVKTQRQKCPKPV